MGFVEVFEINLRFGNFLIVALFQEFFCEKVERGQESKNQLPLLCF